MTSNLQIHIFAFNKFVQIYVMLQEKLQKYIMWLSETPRNIIYRVNTILNQQQVVYNHILKALQKVLSKQIYFI